MHVGVDDIADRLIRNEFLGLIDHGLPAGFALRTVDDDNVVCLVDDETVVAAAAKVVDAVRKLLDFHVHRRWREVLHFIRDGKVHRQVLRDRGDLDLKDRMTRLAAHDAPREAYPIEAPVQKRSLKKYMFHIQKLEKKISKNINITIYKKKTIILPSPLRQSVTAVCM